MYGKLVDKTLADVDYAELSEYVYGQSLSSTETRKMLYGSKRTLDLIDQESLKNITEDDAIYNIDMKMLELQRERKRFYDQRRELNKLISDLGRSDNLYDCLKDAASKLSESVGLMFPSEYFDDDCLGDSEAVLFLSDWHYGMVASNIFNDYNTEICKERIKTVISKSAKRIKLHGCSKLHVVVLGDLCHGAIHTSARVASEELVCDQLMQASEILAQCILELRRCVPEVVVYTTYGNHTRTVQDKNDSIHRDNMERLVPWWLKERLKDIEGITVADESETEFVVLSPCGHDMCAVHGDLDSVKSSPRLLGTLFQKKMGLDLECVVLGDKHHRETFGELGIDSMICGSLCGVDDYANGKRLYSVPSQLLLIFNKDEGLDAEYGIKC